MNLIELEQFFLSKIIEGYTYEKNKPDFDKIISNFLLLLIDETDPTKIASISYWLGRFYIDYNRNVEKMKYYYELAIENGNTGALNDLALYYEEINDFEMMKYYYELAIEQGSETAMYNLGKYYECKGNDEMAKKYYGMASEKGHSKSMFRLGIWYFYKGNHVLMKKYYGMAIEKGHDTAKEQLKRYYVHFFSGDEELMEGLMFFYKHSFIDEWNKMCILAITENINNEVLIKHLFKVSKSNKYTIPPILLTFIKLAQKNIDILDLHFKYAPSADGYEEAKKEFFSLK